MTPHEPDEPAAPVTWATLGRSLQGFLPPGAFEEMFRDFLPLRIAHDAIVLRPRPGANPPPLDPVATEALKEAYRRLRGVVPLVRVLYPAGRPQPSPEPPESPALPSGRLDPFEPALDPRFTLDAFHGAPANRLALAAVRAVAERPGDAYNPLIVFGGPSSGKSHLLQALFRELQQRHPGRPPALLRAGDLQALDEQRSLAAPGAFPARLDAAGCLLVDDVHLLSGRSRSQELIFHLFNALYNSHRQIVATSLLPPREMTGIEDRLLTRLASGLSAELEPLDTETKVRILDRAFRRVSLLPDERLPAALLEHANGALPTAMTLIARLARSHPSRDPLTLDAAERTLDIRLPRPQGTPRLEPPVELIQRHVSRSFGVPLAKLLSRGRPRSVARPRQVAMYLTRQLTSLSLQQIGVLFGGRDPSTVRHAIEATATALSSNSTLAASVKELLRVLGPSSSRPSSSSVPPTPSRPKQPDSLP